ncbi:FecCD family ABC transporter permease [Rhodococcus sp. WAY2]|uniref:FecCD family ABC transporter permease n=1 Tax=Rhodococcus sp. WAY2 TaxID=2663121 RepID=UPI00131FF327|nr:iron ABC transporter permease [Rhodococcus sp. WAY2]QHE72958.1 ABC-type Fe3+-siderophore transport system, permease component [Rhodococcus sp. WAY2]
MTVPASLGRVPLRSGQLAAGMVVLAGALVLVAVTGLAVGTRALPVAEVLAVLGGAREGDAAIIILEQRLPRTVLGLAVGAALGVAGVAAQGLTRNPLADPALLGVSAGAALSVVLGISFFGTGALPAHIGFAIVGAALAGAAVLLLAGRSGVRTNSTELALAGVAVSALLAAATTTLVLIDADTLEEYRFWAVGALSGRGNSTAALVVPVLGVAVLLGWACARWLDALALGDEAARALGLRLGRIRLTIGATVVLLTGVAVAATGPIGFIGLAVPHAARALTGARHGWLVPYAALLGGTLLVLADVLGRIVVRPGELQVGIVTAVVGAPVVLVVLRRIRTAAR